VVRPAYASAADLTAELELDAGWTEEFVLPTRRHRPRHRRDSNLLLKLLIGIMTFAVAVCIGFYFQAWNSYYGGTPATNNHQSDLAQQFQAQIGGPAGKTEVKPLPGQAYAKLTIPRMKKEWYVVEGTNKDDIANAPGHYENTAAPCNKGNFSVAGHRSAAIFGDLDDLQIGDPIIVQTHKKVCTYLVTASFVTTADDWAVVAPLPDSPGEKAKGDYLTLTSCEPWNSITHRIIIHAELSKEVKL
jgi:sortase A